MSLTQNTDKFASCDAYLFVSCASTTYALSHCSNRCRLASSSAHTYRLLVVKEPCLTERRVCRRLNYIRIGCRVSRASLPTAAPYCPVFPLRVSRFVCCVSRREPNYSKAFAAVQIFFCVEIMQMNFRISLEPPRMFRLLFGAATCFMWHATETAMHASIQAA